MQKLTLLCSCLLLSLFANDAGATLAYWDAAGNFGSYGTYTAGSLAGTWESSIWSRNATGGSGAPADKGQAVPVAWNDANNDAAVFAVGAGATNSGVSASTTAFTVTMNSNHTVAGFFDGALNPDSAIVTINGPGIITIPSGLQAFDVINSSDSSLGQIIVDNVLAGTGAPTMEGNGQVFFNGVNTFSGGTFLGFSGASFNGILNFNSISSFGTGSIVVSNGNGCALVVEGTSAVTVTNPISWVQPSASVNIVGNPAGVTFSGPIALSPAPASIGSGGTGNLVILSGVISGGAAGITKFNNSTMQLAGANTFSGATTISAGTLQFGNPAALGFSVATLASGAVIDLNGTSGANSALNLNGTGIGSTGALVNSNLSSTAVLAPANSAVGAVVTSAGANIATPATVTVSGGGGSGAAASADLGVTAASFTINAQSQKYTVAPVITISGGGGNGATATCTLAGASPSVISTTITVTAAGYGFTGTPTITFSGGTKSGTGTVPTGTGNSTHFTLRSIAITAGGSGYSSAPALSFSSGTATATASLASVNLTTTSSVGGPGNTIINSVISGTGSAGLTKVGAGTVTLTAANTYTGPTAINSGTLALTGSGSLLSSGVTVGSGATFDVSGLGSLGQIGVATIGGVAGGTVALGSASQPVSLAFTPTLFTGDATHPGLVVSQSALSLNNNVFFVNNAAATPLGAGIYNLIQVGDGTTGTITGSPNGDVFVGGAGLAPGDVASVSVSGSTVVLVVAASVNATTITLSPASPITYGQSAAYTATVAPIPTGGAVQFYVNGAPLGTPVTVSLIDGTANSIATSTSLAAGSPSITAVYSGSPDDAYSPSSASPVAQVVNPQPMTVTAKDQTTTYGTAIILTGSSQFTSSGLVNGETIGSVTLTVSGGGAATEAVGTYNITPSAATGGTFNAANYNITYDNAATGLTVNPKGLTITAKAQSKVYGTTLPTGLGSTQFTSTALANGETIGSVTLAVSGSPSGDSATAPVAVYTETISAATGGTFTPANYNITYVTGNMTVTAVALSVTASPQTKTYGQTVTTVGSSQFTSSGLANGESIGSVTLAINNNGALATGPVGSDTITPSAATGGTFAPGNYTITYHPGTLTVSPLAVSLIGSRYFDGTAIASASILTVANIVAGDVVTIGGTSASLAAATVGAEQITSFTGLTLGGAAAGNYTLTGAAGSVTINAVPPFSITSESINAAGTQFTMTWSSTATITYHVTGSAVASGPQSGWTTVPGTTVTAAGTSTTVTFAIPTTPPMTFFNVVSP